MNRRELIKHVALLTGAAVAGSEFFLTGCQNRNNGERPAGFFSTADVAFFDEVAETIIPKTNTPGAKEAGVGKFMASYSSDCYDDMQLKILKDGITKLDDASQKIFTNDFIELTPAQKQHLLTIVDSEANDYNKQGEQSKKDQPPHYFTLMKQLVLLGFFTSKPGATQVLRYVPVPGKYQGCIDYKEGETSWV